jgi:enoyl-[acyl-carrier-protein] reductase (NADH)
MRELFDAKRKAAMTWEEFEAFLAGSSHPRRVQRLEEVANAAVLVASDGASGLTGTTVNLTMGTTSD